MRRLLITILISSLLAQAAYAQSRGGGAEIKEGGGVAGSMAPFSGESFQTDLATGAATLSVPITVPPGRKNIQPNIALSYSSNNSNGICGVGWAMPMSYIQRSTKNGVPKYDNTDTFMFVSAGSNAELVDIGDNQYRAKIESAFMKYVFSDNVWTVYDKSGTKYIFGLTSDSRLENNAEVFGWYLDRVEDVYGNYIAYIHHKFGGSQIYLKEIHYTGGIDLPADKKVIFKYNDRADKLYSFRSSWEIITSKYLKSIETYLGETIVWTYELAYEPSGDTGRLLLRSVTVKDKNGISLPPKTFAYQTLE